MLIKEDTIAAIATPLGTGGIGIVRISGPNAETIYRTLFRPTACAGPLRNRFLYHGDIVSPATGAVIDEVLLTVMKGPHSYTGEDTVEINCHGGYLVLQAVLNEVIQAGSRPAEPGEFTRRAYLNNRMDLSQAEAVMDLITAKTDRGRALAVSGMKGHLSEKLESIRSGLIEILISLESSIDFTEEDISSEPYRNLSRDVEDAIIRTKNILSTYKEGKLFRDGLNVVITGKPNVGKSSLLNRLLGEKRAIVASTPGTTRDFIEETINIRGIPVKLTDTAGIRKSADSIEKEGIEFVWEKIQESEIVIVLLDGSVSFAEEDLEVIRKNSNKQIVPVLNKSDLPHKITDAELADVISSVEPLWISAKYGDGISALQERIYSLASGNGEYPDSDVVLTTLRHKISLENTVESLAAAQENIARECSPELAAFDLRSALDHLGDIAGETTNEDVLDKIFSTFCVGK